MVSPRLRLLGEECSPKSRLNAEDREKTGRNVCALDAVRGTANAEVEYVSANRGQIGEAPIEFGEVAEFRRGDPVAVFGNPDTGETHPDHHQTAGIRVGQWAEEHAVDHAENCRVRADSERQRQ